MDAALPKRGLTVRVTIRVRALEAPWGSGPNNPVIRTAEIADTCQECGGPRGTPRSNHTHDDGVDYWVDTWTNPCGHADGYVDVAVEAGLVDDTYSDGCVRSSQSEAAHLAVDH